MESKGLGPISREAINPVPRKRQIRQADTRHILHLGVTHLALFFEIHSIWCFSGRRDKNVSTSARVGIDDCAPGLCTEIAAAALANTDASTSSSPSMIPTVRAAANVSPAAVVSTALLHGPE